MAVPAGMRFLYLNRVHYVCFSFEFLSLPLRYTPIHLLSLFCSSRAAKLTSCINRSCHLSNSLPGGHQIQYIFIGVVCSHPPFTGLALGTSFVEYHTTICCISTISRKTEDCSHELIIVDLDPPSPVDIEPPERLRELFDHDAGTHEAVERDAGGVATICFGSGGVFPLDEVQEVRGEVVAELRECLLELGTVDGARAVSIKVAECIFPVLDVPPEPLELVESDFSVPIDVKEAHEQLDGIEIKGGPISVHKRSLKFASRDRARSVLIYSDKPTPQPLVSTRWSLRWEMGASKSARSIAGCMITHDGGSRWGRWLINKQEPSYLLSVTGTGTCRCLAGVLTRNSCAQSGSVDCLASAAAHLDLE